MIVPMTAGRVIGTRRARGRRARVRQPGRAGRRGLRAARGRGGRERAALPRGVADRAHAADLAAAAGAAGRAGRASWPRRSTPPGRVSRSAATSTTSSRPATGQWYLVIGDVSGKGAEAAAVTALARYTLRTAAARRRSPAAILRWVDEAMVDQDAARGRYCTVACAHVDLARSPARLTVVLRRAPAAGPAARATASVEQIGAYGTLLGLRRRGGAAGSLDRPAPGRHARALHRRADRGAGAALDVGAAGARGGGAARRRWTGPPGSSRAWSRARSASAPASATTSPCWRSSSTPASPRPRLPVALPSSLSSAWSLAGPLSHLAAAACPRQAYHRPRAAAPPDIRYPIQTSPFPVPTPDRGCRKPAAASKARGARARRDPHYAVQLPVPTCR